MLLYGLLLYNIVRTDLKLISLSSTACCPNSVVTLSRHISDNGIIINIFIQRTQFSNSIYIIRNSLEKFNTFVNFDYKPNNQTFLLKYSTS